MGVYCVEVEQLRAERKNSKGCLAVEGKGSEWQVKSMRFPY